MRYGCDLEHNLVLIGSPQVEELKNAVARLMKTYRFCPATLDWAALVQKANLGQVETPVPLDNATTGRTTIPDEDIRLTRPRDRVGFTTIR